MFLPTLLLAVAFAGSVLLYSVQKVFGPGVLSFRNKAQVGFDSGNSPGNSPHKSKALPSRKCLTGPTLVSVPDKACHSTEQDAIFPCSCRRNT